MLLLVFPPYAQRGSELAASLGLRLGHFSIDRFPNRELHVALESSVVNEDGLMLGTIAPPDEQLLSTLLLSHTFLGSSIGAVVSCGGRPDLAKETQALID